MSSLPASLGRWLTAVWCTACVRRPWIGLVLVAAVVALALVGARRFDLDASADSLVVYDDPELAYFREMTERFGTSEFLILTFAPPGDTLFTRDGLDQVAAIEREIEALEGVAQVVSLLDVPLLESPPAPIAELANNVRTLRDPDTDPALARRELTRSPLYGELLVSADGRATAMQIDLEPTRGLAALRERRDALRDSDGEGLEQAERALADALEAEGDARHRLIGRIRGLQAHWQAHGEIHLGGVPMIADDMIEFVRADLMVFGAAITLLIGATLYIVFRRVRWIVLPMLTSAVTVLVMIGLLGALRWPVTVVSSNFAALLVITTISLTIHLIVRYRELLVLDVCRDHAELVERTLRSKFVPCVYTTLTTMVAFGSLTSARIVPVEDFGWMMVIGVGLSLVVTYVAFPALLMLLGMAAPSATAGGTVGVTRALATATAARPATIVVGCMVLAIASGFAMSRLSLENDFVDYFDADTEIHRGMVWIDRHMGGTTPLDVVVELGAYEPPALDPEDDFSFGAAGEPHPEMYWFTRQRMDRIEAVHAWLESQDETGKVLSLATLDRLAQRVNGGERLDSVALALVYKAIPEDLRDTVVRPYADPDAGLARISVRMRESDADLRRGEFLARTRQAVQDAGGFEPDEVRLSGMLVLFNGMLEELFDSQMNTLGWVIGLTASMFWALFRSVRVAVVGLLPTVFAAAAVLGMMGLAGVPLDMMTITIASICVGIGVDDSIHYLHRFSEELNACAPDERRPSRACHLKALRASHASIGSAMYYTTVTVIAGFSVLVFSNFLPSVKFGLFTSLAMALALLANLTLLPALLVLVRPPLARHPMPDPDHLRV